MQKDSSKPMTTTCSTYFHHTDLNATSGALTHRYYVRDYLGSTRAVIDEDGNVLQSTAYYPSGVPLTPNSLTPQTIKFHTGKDFFDLQGAGWYDNQARYYDCLIPTFKSIDPLAEKYPWLSPYNHCANNPLKFIDPDGKDYKLVEDDKTITITATYYTDNNSYDSAKKAIDFWNNQSNKATYCGKNIRFDLTVIDISELKIFHNGSPRSDNSKLLYILHTDNSGSANVYQINDKKVEYLEKTNNENYAGVTSVNKIIYLEEDYSQTTTGAHEIGHTLFLNHKETGIMSTTQDSNRNSSISEDEIIKIVTNKKTNE